MQQRLYVLIDQELPSVYGCVQGSHAVAQYLLDNPTSQWKNDYLIFLKGNLDNIVSKLNRNCVEYTEFKEPDLDNKRTAIAVLNNGNLFKNLNLV